MLKELIQDRYGYRFSMEPFLLVNFIEEHILPKGKGEASIPLVKAKHNYNNRQKLIDIGTGCGIIPRLLLEKFDDVFTIDCVEIQKGLVEKAILNLKNDKWDVNILHEDIKNISRYYKRGDFDYVVSNPPYRKSNTGRKNQTEEKAIARHEIHITLKGLIEIISYLLKDFGSMILIYHPSRLTELITLMHNYSLNPERLQFIYTSKDSDAKMLIIEGKKQGKAGLIVKEPIIIYDNNRQYTKKIQDMYDSYPKVV